MNKITSFAAFLAVTVASQAATTTVGISGIQVDVATNPFGNISAGTTTAPGAAIDAASTVAPNGNIKSFVVTGDYDGDGAADTLSFDLNYFVRLNGGRVAVNDVSTPNPSNSAVDILQLGDTTLHENAINNVRVFVDNVDVSYSDVTFSTESTNFELIGFFGGGTGVIEISSAGDVFRTNPTNGFVNLDTDSTEIGSNATSLLGAGTLLNNVADDVELTNLSGLFIQATVNAVPEPSSAALLGLGGLALLARRKR